MQFIWFLGRFHVLIVHLPLGILTLAVVFEIMVRFGTFRFLEGTVGAIWIAGALSAIGTVCLGLMHATEASFQEMPAVAAHREAGIALCAVACLVALLRFRLQHRPGAAGDNGATRQSHPAPDALRTLFARGALLDRLYSRIWFLPVLIITALMFVTGHLGGNLTHGETYLTEYAPNPIREALGLPLNAATRPKPKDVASADIFLDVVGPALQHRCSTCHNDSKMSGGLSVATYETLMTGGKDGPVVIAGVPNKSDLFRRISLGPDDMDFMPKDGKTPLTKNEVAAIGWWIAQGAPRSGIVGTLKLTPEAASALAAIIGGAQGGQEEQDGGTEMSAEEPFPIVPAAEAAQVAKLVGEGFILRKIDQTSNLLDADYVSAKSVTNDEIADLAKISPQLLRVNLRHAGVTDAMVKTIASFPNLRNLRLEANPGVTDAAAGQIAMAKSLTYVNLVNTKVTDVGFAQVASLPKLKKFYFWGTPITAGAVEKVKVSRKDVVLSAGLSPKDVLVETKVVAPAN